LIMMMLSNSTLLSRPERKLSLCGGLYSDRKRVKE